MLSATSLDIGVDVPGVGWLCVLLVEEGMCKIPGRTLWVTGLNEESTNSGVLAPDGMNGSVLAGVTGVGACTLIPGMW